MSSLIVALPGNEEFAAQLTPLLAAEMGDAEWRRFPDGETYMRLRSDVAGRHVVLVSALDRPDEKFLPLVFAAATARELGATKVGLIAPYLAYMRQDRRFHAGEAITSQLFARQLAGSIDWLVTIDPHLHRLKALSEIYTIPAIDVHVSVYLADWIARSVVAPILIGPDAESEQWVAEVAKHAAAPFLVLEKTRRGDSDVEISVPDIGRWWNHTPVLVDDIVSTARTMIAAIGHLRRAGMKPPVCVGVHAVFAPGALTALRDAGAVTIATTNTIHHETNSIDVTPAIREAALKFLV